MTGSKLPPRNVTVEALSRRACSFRTATEVAEGTLIRLGLDAPGYPVPGLFGRVVSRQGEDHLTALVALTAEERTALGALVDSMGPELEDVATGLAFLEDLDLVKLKAALAEGQRLPALTRLERAGVESGDPPLSRIAVARCRALLLGTLHGSASARGHRLPRQIPLPRWWKEISEARDTIADLCRREDARSPGAPTEALKELRDLESRVWVAVETVDRVGVAVFGRHLDPMVQSATTQVSLQPIVPAPDLAAGLAKEESPSPTPAAAQERPSLRLVLWGLAIAAGLGAAFATRSWLIGDHGEKPLVGIQAEAPAFVEGKIRFRTVFDQRRANAPDPVRIAVVDNSWMGASRAEKTDAVKSLARDLHLKPLQRLEVRDYSGRLRAAWIEPSAR